MQEFELIAKTFQGLEEVLAQELTELGAANVEVGHRMVTFTGDKELLYRANFCLRTAVRVLKPLKHFKAKDADDVYNGVKSVEWSDILDLDTAFAVDSVVHSAEFRHSKFVAYKVKDAIVDYFRERTGQRPNIRISNPDIRLNIHISDDDCTLSLDASGESLHLRGYRVTTVEAPINEVLAAGLLKIAGWDATKDFVDPFCGSGTLLIEAALMAKNIYPGVFRKEFGFEKWKDFDRDLLDRIYNDDSEERTYEGHIYGFDLNKPALEAAAANAKSAGVADIIVLEQRDIRKFTKPGQPALMVTNPPYGERLSPPDVLALYKSLGERLKHEFSGGDAWVISSREECFDQIGLRPSVKHQILNGSLDCNFNKYQIFEGRLDSFRSAGGDVKTDEERALMSEKRRFRQNRDDFKRRFDEEEEEGGDHGFRDRRPRREGRGEGRPFERRDRDDRRPRRDDRGESRPFDRRDRDDRRPRRDDRGEGRPFDRRDRDDRRPRRDDRGEGRPFDRKPQSRALDSYADDEFLEENPNFLALRRRHEEFQRSNQRRPERRGRNLKGGEQ